jgi:hypothetical protein
MKINLDLNRQYRRPAPAGGALGNGVRSERTS